MILIISCSVWCATIFKSCIVCLFEICERRQSVKILLMCVMQPNFIIGQVRILNLSPVLSRIYLTYKVLWTADVLLWWTLILWSFIPRTSKHSGWVGLMQFFSFWFCFSLNRPTLVKQNKTKQKRSTVRVVLFPVWWTMNDLYGDIDCLLVLLTLLLIFHI